MDPSLTASSPSSSSGWAVLGVADYRRFILARLCGNLGIQMINAAVGWQVYQLTGDPLYLGLVGLVQFLPILVLGFPAGHVADTRERTTVLRLCLGLELVCAAILGILAFSGGGAVWPILSTLALLAVGRAFHAPASHALLANLVPKELLPSAIGWSSTVWQAATIAGPALGGLLLIFGSGWVYGLASALLLAATILTARIAPRGVPGSAAMDWLALTGGIRYVWRTKVILGAISLDLAAVLLGGATALLPAFASDILQVGPAGYGWLRAAPAVGAVLTGLYLAQRPIRRRLGVTMLMGVGVYGAAILAFGLSTAFWLSLLALAVSGAADMFSVFVRHSLVQLATPDAMRGRVAAVNSVFITASNELGEFESGIVAALIGVVPCVVAGAIGTLLVAAAAPYLFPALRVIDRIEDVLPPERAASG